MPAIKKNSLAEYRKKRRFKITPEPKGALKKRTTKKTKVFKFVVHYHEASHKHYDLRLEVGGVLKSWAVPKGPPTRLSIKHLAIPTEDHPLDYVDFEGTIPEGQYGAGTVEIWDSGTYRNIKEKDGKIIPLNQCIKDGRIEIFFEGKKLHGPYVLIRTKFSEDKPSWLWIKMSKKKEIKKKKSKKS